MSRLRRLAALWCLSAALCGQVAQAKVLVAHPDWHDDPLAPNIREFRVNNIRNLRLLESILRSTGANFSTVPYSGTKTEWLRTGAQVWNLGNRTPLAPGPDSYVEQFDGVIQIGGNVNAIAPLTTRPDSLTRLTVQGRSGRAVPMLMMRDNSGLLLGAGTKFSAADSAGVTADDNGPGKAIYFAGDGNAFLSHAYVAAGTGFYDTGDIRRILFGGVPSIEYMASASDDNLGVRPCRQCDSLQSYASNDTLILWDRQYNKRIPHANTIVFAQAFGAGAASDSLQNSDYSDWRPPTEGDFAVMLAALAHLDSLVRADTNSAGVRRNGKVLGDKVIKIAPIVYGGLARGERHAWKSPGAAQGILASDTSAFYAILDSVNALGIPITFAINPDSASSYERDLIKMKQVGKARFTPQIWNGIADTTKAGLQNAKYRPVDVFGRYRNRFAIGDDSGLGADSSIKTLAKNALRLVDSLTSGRVSRVAVAPDDDWSPLNTNGVLKGSGRVLIDSVLYALQQAGYVGVVSDAQDPDASGMKREGPAASNPRGFYNRQQSFSSGSVSGLRDFKILTHTGYAIMGGRAQTITPADSLPPYVNGNIGLVYKELARVWSGALLDFDNSYDTWPYDDIASPAYRNYDNILQRKVDRTQAAAGRPVVRGNVYRLSCADLSGRPDGPPAANGYHVLKALRNAMLAINKLAGRTVVTFAYPEDIEP